MHGGERLDDQLATMRNVFVRNFSNCSKRVGLRFQGLKTRRIAVDACWNGVSQRALNVLPVQFCELGKSMFYTFREKELTLFILWSQDSLQTIFSGPRQFHISVSSGRGWVTGHFRVERQLPEIYATNFWLPPNWNWMHKRSGNSIEVIEPQSLYIIIL